MVENLRICNLRTAHICGYLRICDMQLNQEKFADLKFLDSHILEIWGFLIANWAQEFGDLKKFACPPLQICQRCQPYWRQSCRWCTLSCEYFRKFLKNLKRPNGILRGLGDTDSWKNWNRKSCGTVPLKFLLNVQNWKPQILTGIPIQLEAIFHDCEST